MLSTNCGLIYPKMRALKPLFKRVPTGEGTKTTLVRDGWQEIWYEVYLDTPALHALARKAADSKSGKAKDGPLRIKILECKTMDTVKP